MHRSVYSISEKFVEATDSGRLDEGCVRVSARYIIARCKELIERFGIRAVYLVMDGKRIPLKADESHDRDMKRQQNLGEARRLKRSGNRWKAEDKYKTCIRIKDNFTNAVIKEVKRAFSDYGRVHLVHSPHEADSQLTRLVLDGVADAVITEDSDVLVYSAAAHVGFPILFKLDRKTGDCDCINMDWLLSLSLKEAEKPVTSTNTLEVIFRRLAARQAKRRGFGVRLFVQGCILAGCDYRKNIEGIGPTNAFKLVRDNAFRNDSVRFRKILESLPKKTKQNIGIDINEYEEILAKSEAIFFYHPVLHTDGNVKPLLTPRLSPEECGDEHHFTDHYPYMSRFEGDWSFLGTITSSDSSESNVNVEQINNESVEKRQWVPPPQVGPTKTTTESSSVVPTNKRACSQLLSLSSSTQQSKVIHNPYKRSRSYDNNAVGFPLEEKNVNTRISAAWNNENVANRQPTSRKRVVGDITRFLVKPDPRYTRRSLSSTTTSTSTTAGSSFRISSRSLASKKSPGRSFFSPRSSTKKQQKSTGFDYDSKLNLTMEETAFVYSPLNHKSSSSTEQHTVVDDNGPESTTSSPVGDGVCNLDPPDFYDLTQSNSCDADELVEDGPIKINGTRESHDETEKDGAIRSVPPEAAAVTIAMEGSDNGSKNLDTSLSTDQLRETEQRETRTSKYFLKRTGGSRRVTLDSFTRPSSSRTSDFGNTNAVGKSSQGLVDSSVVNSFFSPRKQSKDKV